jgi:hypothetical protein
MAITTTDMRRSFVEKYGMEPQAYMQHFEQRWGGGQPSAGYQVGQNLPKLGVMGALAKKAGVGGSLGGVGSAVKGLGAKLGLGGAKATGIAGGVGTGGAIASSPLAYTAGMTGYGAAPMGYAGVKGLAGAQSGLSAAGASPGLGLGVAGPVGLAALLGLGISSGMFRSPSRRDKFIEGYNAATGGFVPGSGVQNVGGGYFGGPDALKAGAWLSQMAPGIDVYGEMGRGGDVDRVRNLMTNPIPHQVYPLQAVVDSRVIERTPSGKTRQVLPEIDAPRGNPKVKARVRARTTSGSPVVVTQPGPNMAPLEGGNYGEVINGTFYPRWDMEG